MVRVPGPARIAIAPTQGADVPGRHVPCSCRRVFGYIYPVDDRLLTVLIVDDEPIARRVLRDELDCCANVRVIGDAGDGKEALAAIATLRPDIVFLDVDMPAMNGFEVVRSLTGSPLPVVVMVTAFDRDAIQALEAGGVDYLLKPVSGARLQKALERAHNLLNQPAAIRSHIEAIARSGRPTPRDMRRFEGAVARSRWNPARPRRIQAR